MPTISPALRPDVKPSAEGVGAAARQTKIKARGDAPNRHSFAEALVGSDSRRERADKVADSAGVSATQATASRSVKAPRDAEDGAPQSSELNANASQSQAVNAPHPAESCEDAPESCTVRNEAQHSSSIQSTQSEATTHQPVAAAPGWRYIAPLPHADASANTSAHNPISTSQSVPAPATGVEVQNPVANSSAKPRPQFQQPAHEQTATFSAAAGALDPKRQTEAEVVRHDPAHVELRDAPAGAAGLNGEFGAKPQAWVSATGHSGYLTASESAESGTQQIEPPPQHAIHAAPNRSQHASAAGTEALRFSTTTDPEPSHVIPAAARAVQIDTAVRLEQVTAQPASLESTAIHHAPPGGPAATPPLQLGTPQSNLFMAESSAGHDSLPDDPKFSQQVARGLTAMMNQRGGIMSMRLDPPELGELRVQMTIARGVVAAEFQAGSQQTQALLERNIFALRTALESQGLTVDKLIVHSAPTQNHHGMRSDANGEGSNQQSLNERHNAAEGESRGRRDSNDPNSNIDDAPFLRREVDFDQLFSFDSLTPFAAATP